MRRFLGLLAAAAVLTGCSTTPPGSAPQDTTSAAASSVPSVASSPSDPVGSPTPGSRTAEVTGDAPAATDITALLASIPVKGRAPKTGYDRALFGPAWTDDVSVAGGHNGCDTRNDILRRDLVEITLKPGTGGCTVLTGMLHDPYTGTVISFTRGQGTSAAVQIDHVVAVADAWQKGAQQLTPTQRENLANDPLNLQAVDGPTNESKGAGDAATWLPPNKTYRCTYVSRQVQVKAKYHLWVTAAERAAIMQVLADCATPPPATMAPPPPAPVATPPAPPPAQATPPGGVYYKNCTAARAAGVAPLYTGDPGYRPGLDRDRDGIACEP